MSKLTDCKLSVTDFEGKLVSHLPDRPSQAGMTAQQLKERFDAGSLQVLTPALNALIDALGEEGAAAAIGSEPIEGVFLPDGDTPANTVYTQLVALRRAIDDLVVGVMPEGSVHTGQLASQAVTSAKIAPWAVTGETIATGAVSHDKLRPDLAEQVDAALGVDNIISQAALFPKTLTSQELEELMADESSAAILEQSAVATGGPEIGMYSGHTETLEQGRRYEFFVTLGFRPRAVLVLPKNALGWNRYSTSSMWSGGLAVDGSPVDTGYYGFDPLIWITDTGFGVCTYLSSADNARVGQGAHHFVAWR